MKLSKDLERQILELAGELVKDKKSRKPTGLLRPARDENPKPDPGDWRLFIPKWFPSSANVREYKHWSKGKKAKDGDKKMVAVYFAMSGIPKAIGRRVVSITLVYPTRRSWRDSDNILKSALDALVACQAIRDDSDKWFELGSVKHRLGSKDDWGTEFSIAGESWI